MSGENRTDLAKGLVPWWREQPDAIQEIEGKVVVIDHKFNETAQPLPRIDRVSAVTASDDLGSYRTKSFPSTRTKAKRKAQRIARKKTRRHK